MYYFSKKDFSTCKLKVIRLSILVLPCDHVECFMFSGKQRRKLIQTLNCFITHWKENFQFFNFYRYVNYTGDGKIFMNLLYLIEEQNL